jgi:hypothetical protein
VSIRVTFAGVDYDLPTTGDEDFWGLDLTSYLVALSNHSATGITLAAVGSAPNANGATLSGTTLNLQPADDTHPGVVSTGTQTFAGDKTVDGNLAATNLSGNNTGDVSISGFSATPSAKGLNNSGQAIFMTAADGTRPGGVSTAAQTFAGAKTFANSPVFSTATHVRANRNSSALSLSVGTTAVVFSTEEYDTRNEYDPTTGIFTAAEAGYYAVKATVTTNAIAYVAGDALDIELWKNGAKLQLGNQATCEANATEYFTLVLSTTLLLAASDTLQVKCAAVGHASAIYSGATTGATTFTIDRLF